MLAPTQIPNRLVSVVIPTYNRKELIGETIDSVLAQTYKDLEVIVVDDGSTDGTGDYLKNRYAQESRFRYIWQRNAERSVARNTGITAAKGDYVAFLDSDDLWLPEKLECQMRLLTAHAEMVMVVTWWADKGYDSVTANLSPNEEEVTCDDFPLRMLAENRIGALTTLVRRQTLLDVGMFCSRFCQGEDWEVWTAVSFLGKVGVVPRVLAHRRIHQGNTEKPIPPRSYLELISNLRERLGEAHWKQFKSIAIQSYWKRLNREPSPRINMRKKFITLGKIVFGDHFIMISLVYSYIDFIKYLAGPNFIRYFRKIIASFIESTNSISHSRG